MILLKVVIIRLDKTSKPQLHAIYKYSLNIKQIG